MKIILYIVLIAIVVIIGYGLITRLGNVDFSGLGESISSAFDNVASWINEKIQYIGSKLEE